MWFAPFERGRRRVCHGAPATSAPVDHAFRTGWGRTARKPRSRSAEESLVNASDRAARWCGGHSSPPPAALPLTRTRRARAPTAPSPPAARWTASRRSAVGASRWRFSCDRSPRPCRARSCLPPTRPPPESQSASAPGFWPPGRDRHDAGAPARQSAPARRRAALRARSGSTISTSAATGRAP